MKTLHNPSKFADLSSNDEGTPALCGVLLNADKSELCATDGHVLGVCKVDTDDNDCTAILPSKSLQYKSGTANKPKDVTFEVNGAVKRKESLGEETATYEYNLIEERFPDYESVLPWKSTDPSVFKIRLDLKLLHRIAAAIPTVDKSVEMTFYGETRAVDVRPSTDDDDVNEAYHFLVMPLKIQ